MKKIYNPLQVGHQTVKKSSSRTMLPGRKSPLSALIVRLKRLKPNKMIVLDTTSADQKIVALRLRSNIFKWKKRHGLGHVSVHQRKDGKIQLLVQPKQKK